MLFLLFLGLMYFLPTIIGREKSDAGFIFLVNLLLGWTVVGWIAGPVCPGCQFRAFLQPVRLPERWRGPLLQCVRARCVVQVCFSFSRDVPYTHGALLLRS